MNEYNTDNIFAILFASIFFSVSFLYSSELAKKSVEFQKNSFGIEYDVNRTEKSFKFICGFASIVFTGALIIYLIKWVLG